MLRRVHPMTAITMDSYSYAVKVPFVRDNKRGIRMATHDEIKAAMVARLPSEAEAHITEVKQEKRIWLSAYFPRHQKREDAEMEWRDRDQPIDVLARRYIDDLCAKAREIPARFPVVGRQ